MRSIRFHKRIFLDLSVGPVNLASTRKVVEEALCPHELNFLLDSSFILGLVQFFSLTGPISEPRFNSHTASKTMKPTGKYVDYLSMLQQVQEPCRIKSEIL
jgi:hypothetical protein